MSSSAWHRAEGAKVKTGKNNPAMGPKGGVHVLGIQGTVPVAITEYQMLKFKEALMNGWRPGYAASLAGIGVDVARRRRKEDPEFDKLWRDHMIMKDRKNNSVPWGKHNRV